MKYQVVKGDITKMETDAIVNAANSSLMGGSGVDGAIHSAGGSQILEECIKIRENQGGCNVGEAVITTAGNLKAKNVIHTVGPQWTDGNSDEATKLRNCYLHSLKLAEENGLTSISFPNISTGTFGYPKAEAAAIAIETIKNFESKSITQINFVCFDEENYRLYTQHQ